MSTWSRLSQRLLALLLLGALLLAGAPTPRATAQSPSYPFQDASLPLETRMADLLGRLTLSEKVSLLHQYQPAISRLGIRAFTTGQEALHGLAWEGSATVFPQAIGFGSTWNPALIGQIGSAVGDEARGFYYRGTGNLNVWAPVVDPLRDPRAGRNEEGYAEDPYLTGQLAIAYAGGLRGGDPFYYKTAPTLKHFFAYNNEINRDITSSNVDPRNMHEYYFKPFRAAIESGKATGVMTSYNLVNGRPATVSEYLNSQVRRWTSQPLMMVSDAHGPSNVVNSQRYYATQAEGHAAALKAGLDSFTDQGSSNTLTVTAINSALSQGLLTQADVDTAVRHILSIRFHLGDFDQPARSPYAGITDAVINAPAHQTLARQAAREQMVLLKNNAGRLPLDRAALRSVAVIGPRSNQVLTDFYSGSLPYTITPLDAIRSKVGGAVTVNHAVDNTNGAAVNAARASDVALVIVGNHPTCNAGWAQCPALSEVKEAFDRRSISLDDSYGQETLIQQVFAANPNTVVVLVSSFPYAINWTNANVPAILWSSHAGQELGNALADVLFGDYAPAGRLTQTWYSSLSGMPSILEYDIIKHNRTYLYYEGTPLYPFGHGLTYVPFTYSNLRLSAPSVAAGGQVTVSVDVTNGGTRASDEVVQLYVHARQSRVKRPLKELKGFSRVNVLPGQTRTVSLTLPAAELAFWDVTREKFVVESGTYDVMVGRSSADIKLTTALAVGGETIPPRNLQLLTRAENYDDYSGARLVDETKASGTAVAATAAGQWLSFRQVDFGGANASFSASVANPGGATTLELRLGSPSGALVGTASVPSTGSAYGWTTVTTPVSGLTGLSAWQDLYLVFRGAMQIRTLSFQGGPTPSPTATRTGTGVVSSPTSTRVPPTATRTSTGGPVSPTRTSTMPPAANLLLNGGFELDSNPVDNKPDSWGTSASISRSSAARRSGSYSLRHYSTGNVSYVASQVVGGITPGTSYGFSGWTSIPATGDTFSYRIELVWRNSANSTLRTDVVRTFTAANGGAWEQASGSYVAPANATNVVVRMNVSSLAATIYADDFSLARGATPPTVTRTSTSGSTPSPSATRTSTTQPATPTRTGSGVPLTATSTRVATGTSTSVAATPTATTGAASGLRVQYRAAETAASTNQLKPHLNVVNGGSATVALSELKLRYYYSKEGTAGEQYFCDYAVVGCGTITGSFGQGYLELGFSAGSLAPGAQTGEIQSRVAKTDWSPYTQTGDYSFDSTRTAFADWSRVTLHRNGVLVWGAAP